MTTTTAPGGLTISAVSDLLGIPVPTIRSWERRYGFPAPARTGGRHRRYAVDEVEQLRALRDEITRGHPARDAVGIVRAADGGGERGTLFDELLAAATRLDPDGVRDALDRADRSLGMEAAIRDVALPSMREVGARWRAGVCDTAHEHLATEVVRGWLARASATAAPPARPDAVVLACGPKDLHTIGLEAFGVVLARRGWPVRMLGPLTPTDSLVTALRASGARAAVVSCQRSVARRPAVASIAAAAAIPGVRACYGGAAFAAAGARRDVPGTSLGDDVVRGAELLERELFARERVGA